MTKFQKHKGHNQFSHSKGQGNVSKPQSLTIPQSFPDVRYKKAFWLGPPGEDEPSAQVKEQRKNLGILVKGKRLSLCPAPLTELSDTGLTPEALKLLTSLNITKPSVIQMQAWPAILSGSDVLGIAPTGSGKSLAFVLPMIPHILHRFHMIRTSNQAFKGPSGMAIVLVPTRELCVQISNYLRPLSKLFGIQSCCFYGGQDKDTQLTAYRANGGAHVLVCTPGRLLDVISDKQVNLSHVTYVVLDESDRMLSLGFEEQLNQILSQIRPDRQTVLFSASFPGRLREAASRWMRDEVVIRCNTLEVAGPRQHDGNSSSRATDSSDLRGEGATEAVSDKALPIMDSTIDQKRIAVESATKKRKIDSDEDGEQDNNGPDTHSGDADSAFKSAFNQSDDPPDATPAGSSSSSVAVSSTIVQTVHVCASHKKPRLFLHFIERLRKQEKEENKRQLAAVLVFCTKIKTIGFVMDFLKRHNQSLGVGMLHGNMLQSDREKTLEHFRAVILSYLSFYIIPPLLVTAYVPSFGFICC